MANGLLYSGILSAATNTVVYTVPVGKTATLVVNMCDTGENETLKRLAVSSTSSPDNGGWIEYNASSRSIERMGIVLTSGQKIIAYSVDSGVNVNIWGYEE